MDCNNEATLIEKLKAITACESDPPSPPPEIPVKLRNKSPLDWPAVDSHSDDLSASEYDNLRNTSHNFTSLIASTPKNDLHGQLLFRLSPTEYQITGNTWSISNHSISCPHHLSSQAIGAISSNLDCQTIQNNSQHHFSGQEIQHASSFHDSLKKEDTDDDSIPPPLPPKKRNIMTYMQLMGTYNGPNDATLSLYRHSVHSYHLINASHRLQSWHQLESTFVQQHSLHQNYPVLTSRGSKDSVSSFASSHSDSMRNFHHQYSPSVSTSSLHNFTQSISSSPNIDDPGVQLSSQSDLPPSLPPKRKNNAILTPVISRPWQLSNELVESIPESTSNKQVSPTSSPGQVPSSESGISSQSESIKVDNTESGQSLGILDEIDVSSYLIYKNVGDDGPEIRGGPIDALVVKATEFSKNNLLFQEAFLTTYRTFVSPIDLINKLLHRHSKYANCTDAKQRAAKFSFALLMRVVDDLCITDCTDVLMQNLLEFTYQLVTKGDLALALVLRTKVLEKFSDRPNKLYTSQVLLPSIGLTTKTWTLHDFKSGIIAEQMTLLDASLFQKIEVAEYLLWAREQKEELIPNLNKFTEHFNKMSYWARHRIVELEDTKKREKLALKFIRVMKHLRKINNYNSYLALLSALDSGPIRRLDWPKSVTENLKDLCTLIDSSSSFRAYRQALAETQPPCIPYIGLILQDLTFVHVGNSDYLQDSSGKNVNFAKRWQIFNILDQMQRFRSSHYPFKKNEQVLAFFNNFDDYLSEEAVWQISESMKPRNVSNTKK